MSQLLSGERAIAGVRQSSLVLIPTIFTSLVALVVVAVIIHFVPGKVFGHSTDSVRTGVILIAILIALGAVALELLQWRAATYTLTTHRVIMTKGIVSRSTESISLDRIQDTVVRRNLWQRLLGCGDIEIESAGRDGLELLHQIPDPDGFYRDLMEAMEAYRHPGSPSSEATLPVSPPGGV
jgi:uncharacterized membrane protein YdbT with pleckstrin-like domain